jgi:hypothetical protein
VVVEVWRGRADTSNQAPCNRVYRRILQDYIHDAAGTVVAFEEITAYKYNASTPQRLNARGQVTGMGGNNLLCISTFEI